MSFAGVNASNLGKSELNPITLPLEFLSTPSTRIMPLTLYRAVKHGHRSQSLKLISIDSSLPSAEMKPRANEVCCAFSSIFTDVSILQKIQRWFTSSLIPLTCLPPQHILCPQYPAILRLLGIPILPTISHDDYSHSTNLSTNVTISCSTSSWFRYCLRFTIQQFAYSATCQCSEIFSVHLPHLLARTRVIKKRYCGSAFNRSCS